MALREGDRKEGRRGDVDSDVKCRKPIGCGGVEPQRSGTASLTAGCGPRP